MKKLQETTQVEFFTSKFNPDFIYARYKHKEYDLLSFSKMASWDDNVQLIFKSLRALIIKYAFKGTGVDFIKKYFMLDSEKPDIFIRNGNIEVGSKKGWVEFDAEELKLGDYNS